MTVPDEEEEVVVELRLQPVVARPDGWRGRSGGLIAAGLAAFIVVGIALGTVFGTGRPASSAAAIALEPSAVASPTASRRPTPTRRPQLPPLPALEIVGGQIPTERRLVYANGLQVLDLSSGVLTTPARPWEDLILPLPNDEFVCVCMTREGPTGDATTSTVSLRVERFDAFGTTIVEHEAMTFDGIVAIPEMDLGFTMSAALSTDDRSLYVMTAVRRPPVWTVEVHQVDPATGELIASTLVDELAIDVAEPGAPPSPSPFASPTAKPDGTPPDGLHVWANALVVSPNGAAVVATIAYSIIRGDVWTNGFHEFLMPIADGRVGQAVTIDEGTEVANGWCIGPPEFVDDELIVQVCLSPDPTEGEGEFRVLRLTTTGEEIGDVALRSDSWAGHYQLAIALDRGRRSVVAWDPVAHGLSRVSVDDGALFEREVARAMLPDESPTSDRGYFGAEPGLVLSPDGRRIYALGFALGPSDSGVSTGVWVFDANTFNLVDRWLPRAMLTSLAVSADGRFVYAAGAQGFDVEGNQAPNWPGSVTVYDAETGDVQVVYGDVSRDSWVNFRPLP
jgi:hypothetical protein